MSLFTPLKAAGDLAVSTTSATVAIPTNAGQIILDSDVTLYIAWVYGVGGTATAVSGSGQRIRAGVVMALGVPAGATGLAYVGTGAGILNVTFGSGE